MTTREEWSQLAEDLRCKSGPMEFFILAAIDKGGLDSLYLLQTRANLQPGGIRPALERLQAGHALKRSAPARRGIRPWIVTEFGRYYLTRYAHDVAKNYPDEESILRAAAVLLLIGDTEAAAEYLQTSGDWLYSKGSAMSTEGEGLISKITDPIEHYMHMRMSCEGHARAVAGLALNRLGEYLLEKLTENASHNQQQSRNKRKVS